MPDLPPNVWVLTTLIAGACVLAMLHSLATMVRVHVHVEELKTSVSKLRADYAERVRLLEEMNAGDVEILNTPAQPAPEAKPAEQAAA